MFAVVAMDCLLPGALDAEAWIRLSEPRIRRVDPGRWPGIGDEPPTTVEGAFVDGFTFDPQGLDVPFDALDPLFGWVLHVVRGVVPAERQRTSLTLATLGLPSTGHVRAVADRTDIPWLRGGHPLDLVQAGGPAVVAARALGLGGEVDALDAACASGLYAVRVACDQLQSGAADCAIAAAVNRSDSSYLFQGFTQLHALSPSGVPRPFDRRADGLVIGEGAVAVALKRLDDAIRDEDRIHAVIRSTALGADGRKGNMLAPAVDGQLRTLRRAWEQAGVDPETVGFVECHATGTTLGDGTELRALEALLARRDRALPRVVVASAKGMVGHTVTAAGLAGLIRAVGAVRDGVLPRSVGCEEPRAELTDSAVLRVATTSEPWEGPRRAAVSAFGFGGTNAHLVVDGWDPPVQKRAMTWSEGPGKKAGPGPSEKTAAASVKTAVASAKTAAASAKTAGASGGTGAASEETGAASERAGAASGTGAASEKTGAATEETGAASEKTGAATEGTGPATERTAADSEETAPASEKIAATPSPRIGERAGVRGAATRITSETSTEPATLGLPSPPLPAAGRGGNSSVIRESVEGRHAAGFPALAVVAMAVWKRTDSSSTHIPGSRYRIPPVELAELLPQQRLALDLATDVLDRTPGLDPARTASIVGFEVDPAIDAAVIRWALLADHQPDAADRVHPPLRTSRVQGSLPNFLANRIAAQHDLQGPSYVVAAGAASGTQALRHAARLLVDPTLDAVVVGAVSDHAGAMFVVRRADADPVLAVLHLGPAEAPPDPTPDATTHLLVLVDALQRGAPVAIGGVTLEPVGVGGPTLPLPRPRSPRGALRLTGDTPTFGPLPWPHARGRRPTVPIAPAAPLPAPVDLPTHDLARALARATTAAADAHARYLDASERALAPLAALGEALAGTVSAPAHVRTPSPTRPAPTPTTWDRAALIRHASGPLSSVFGPRYQDLDRYEPHVRMPLPPLLLVDRVTAIEGERGQFGPSRIITEYDVPHGQQWTADGRPPAFVVVESGQADLFLVSFLGIDAECRGERVYRLLDCDLQFVGPRPAPGTTLRHDIRIERFARLGVTTLFYFRYDCVDAATGTPVLQMRNGCAGFFTPRELASPRGLVDSPRDIALATPLVPRIGGAPSSLDDAAVDALVDGRFSIALGPAFAPADGSTLRLPPDRRWRLVHRVVRLSLAGGPHGHGEVVVEQDLRDDDWFNPVHFHGDPCMPGTLMLEGCLQAVQVWLSAQGVAADYPTGTFEVVADRPIRLRCRGQVAPGHRVLRYHARIVEAGLEPHPYAIADVVLSVDGTPVVVAHDVGVRVDGERVRQLLPGHDRILEYSVGSAVRAFGPGYTAFDGPDRRCARMPGPPILQMTEVLAVEGPPGEVAADRSATIVWDVPSDAWFWRADPQRSLPFVVLLETALQPCGWLTAWQEAGIVGGADLYFRNLGGTATQHVELWPDAGRLVTTARQTAVSGVGAMQIQRFTTEVRAGRVLVFSCETQFGYFTKAALLGQKGLTAAPFPSVPPVDVPLAGHPALPRDDLRMIDRIVGADPAAGRYVAVKDVAPSDWYFTAHFWLDPVMPGSLGLEALLQLARWVFHTRTGHVGETEVVPIGEPMTWTYRGQVLRHNAVMRVELEILSEDASGIRCRGWIRADDLPIYVFENFGVKVIDSGASRQLPVKVPQRRELVTALLDTFEVHGDQGAGQLHLDPAIHPWLDQHRPTMAAAAVPLAFVAEIAAEAAALLAPGREIVGVPDLRIERWIHTHDGPVDLTVVAVRNGPDVAVTLAVGALVHARGVIRVGDGWPAAPPALEVEGATIRWDGPSFFASGRTFHGPVLQGMVELTVLGATSASAVLRTRPDGELLGRDGRFVLDPLLLDSATHPMLSGEPERWDADLPPGRLAYPIRVEGLALYGPRPTGDVTCRIVRVPSGPRELVFDVELASASGTWCTYRWHEVVVPGGPVLGQPPAIRRRFLWDGEGLPEVTIGRRTERGWEVRPGDVVEPIPGTLTTLYGAPGGPLEVLACKEVVRQHLRDTLGRDVHPKDLVLVPLRPDTWIVAGAPSLTAVDYVAHLHPTRWVITVVRRGVSVEARIGPPP